MNQDININYEFLKAVKRNNLAQVINCLKNNPDLNFENEAALNYASSHNYLEITDLLLKQPNITLKNGENIFKAVVWNQQKEMAELFIKKGIDPKLNNNWAIDRAGSSNSISMVKMLLGYLDINEVGKRCAKSALHQGSIGVVNYLMEQGVDIKTVLKEEGSFMYQLYPQETIDFVQSLKLKKSTKNNKNQEKIKPL